MSKSVWKNNKRPLFGGILGLILSLASTFFIGHLSDYSSHVMLKNLIPNINVLFNTVILACSTILALLLQYFYIFYWRPDGNGNNHAVQYSC